MTKTLCLLAGLVATAGAARAQAPAATPAPAPAANTFSVPAPAYARGQVTPAQLVERRMQYLTQQLGLSADQQARLAPILLAQRQQVQAMREGVTTNGRRRGVGPELKAAQAKYLEQINAVLTPAQATKFAQLQDEQREKMRARRGTPATPGAPDPE